MTPSHKTSICLTLLIVSAVAAGPSSSGSAPAASPITTISANLQGRFGDSLFFQPGRGPVAGPMLVVPDKEIDAATVGRIIEDLSIMARIIKKNSASVINFDAATSPYGRMPFTNPYVGPSLLFSSGGQPRPLYVAGYGALFFIQVDFPLAAAEQPTTTEQSETDAVWAEARQSLSESQPTNRYRRGAFNGPQPYSRERVDALQSSLIATMKHAANIRGLEPTEWLMIVVQGTSSQTDGSASAAGDSTALTLRATKANIDLYAKGELGQPEFEQRLQVVAR